MWHKICHMGIFRIRTYSINIIEVVVKFDNKSIQ